MRLVRSEGNGHDIPQGDLLQLYASYSSIQEALAQPKTVKEHTEEIQEAFDKRLSTSFL